VARATKKPTACASTKIPHLRKTGTATQLIVDGKPFVMLAGEIHNSSSSNLEYMERVWDKLVTLNCNTAIVPLSWELTEPVEGKFDFTLVDGLVKGARKHNLRLVFLWFGTWKNAVSSYVPAWVKTDLKRFARAQCEPGRSTGAISCLCDAACDADARAFAAVMRHIRKVDGKKQTVLMMQVENETGLLGAPRDHSPAADARFARAVPPELMSHLDAHKGALIPWLKRSWDATGCRPSGTWAGVFGAAADEVFMAWHVARFVDRVAAAGKAEHPLPMYANAWLTGSDEQQPGTYPSGGPVSKVMDIWRAAAPHIDLLAPDIYMDDFRSVCAWYTQSGNPLLIPEAHRDERSAANVFYAIGQHDAICFGPFGIDSAADASPLAQSYELLASLMPLITKHQGTGRMVGMVQQAEKETRDIEMGAYRLRAHFKGPVEKGRVPGCGLVIALADDEYLVAGSGFSMEVLQGSGDAPNVDILTLDEGRFEAGKWVPGRRLNGDENGAGRWMWFGSSLSVQRVKLYSYA
jgi:hypothetical protein